MRFGMRLYTVTSVGLLATLSLASCVSTTPETTKANSPVQKEPVIALVLGGGGAKGFAHVGVIKELEANGIKPDLIVGTSIGSVIGSLYASGKSADELETLALTTKDSELTDFTLSYQGVIEGLKLRQFINTQVNNQPIENFPIRFASIATEKNTLTKKVFTQGEAGIIVQASSSVPNIFIAPRIPEKVGKKYIDGGVSSMMPVNTAKSLGADVVIAVDLQVAGGQYAKQNKSTAKTNEGDIWSLMDSGYQSYQQTPKANNLEVNNADIILRPNVSHISTLDTSRRDETIEAGALITKQNLPAIINAIKQAEQKYSVTINP